MGPYLEDRSKRERVRTIVRTLLIVILNEEGKALSGHYELLHHPTQIGIEHQDVGTTLQLGR